MNFPTDSTMPSSLKVQTLQQTLLLNNTGIAYLAGGDLLNGVRSLARALNLVNQYVAQTEAAGPHAEAEDPNGKPCAMEPYPILGFVQNELFYVFNEALVFRSPEDINSLQHCDVCSTTGVLLFNLALTFHQQGLVTGNDAKLTKAMHMYNESCRLLQEVQTEDSSQQALKLTRVVLAAANNQAAISYQQQNYDSTTQHLEQVRASYLDIVNHAGTTSDVVLEPQLEEIVLNFTTLSSPPTTAPVA